MDCNRITHGIRLQYWLYSIILQRNTLNSEFYFTEYSGFPIYRFVENHNNPSLLPMITTPLQEKDEVFVNIFGQWCKGTIVKLKGQEGFWAETHGSICPLDFDQDDRHCWTCSSAINKAAIQCVS